jgi:hypothetical protein
MRAFPFAVTDLAVRGEGVTVTVLVLLVYCIVVKMPETTSVAVDHTVELTQLVVVVKMVVVTVTFASGPKNEAPT